MSTNPECRFCSQKLIIAPKSEGGNWSEYRKRKRDKSCSACRSQADADRRAVNAVPRLYAIVNEEILPGYVKIGLTDKNPSFRLSVYNTSDPLRRFRFGHQVQVSNSREAEAKAHAALAQYRVDGSEWFKCPLPVVITVLNSLATKPWSFDVV